MNKYENPLVSKYSSKEIQYIFSNKTKFLLWRKLWIALAESQKECGLSIKHEQIDEMKKFAKDINYVNVKKYEKETHHDVMAHIFAYGDQCKKAKPIIHLGATSCYITDNAEIIIQRLALLHIKKLILEVLENLKKFAEKTKNLACISYTHFQAAQPTTVGKRAAIWAQDLLIDLEQLDNFISKMKLLGCKGATGTSASFLSIFNGSHAAVQMMEEKIVIKMGFKESYSITGQTYSRKLDHYLNSVLSGIAQSAYKFSNDIRLLSQTKEIEEFSEKNQIGSSAMPYKKNPIFSERIAGLSRYVIINSLNPALTASSQWLERTLDDSANRRIAIPEAFLAIDAILCLYKKIVDKLVVNPKIIEERLCKTLPYIVTENILMYCVKKGKDRQLLHERIRIHAKAAMKNEAESKRNDLISRIALDEAFGISEIEINELLSSEEFTGRAKEQTEELILIIQDVLNSNLN